MLMPSECKGRVPLILLEEIVDKKEFETPTIMNPPFLKENVSVKKSEYLCVFIV